MTDSELSQMTKAICKTRNCDRCPLHREVEHSWCLMANKKFTGGECPETNEARYRVQEAYEMLCYIGEIKNKPAQPPVLFKLKDYDILSVFGEPQ